MRYSIGYEIPSTFTTADYNPNASLTLTFTKSDGTTTEVSTLFRTFSASIRRETKFLNSGCTERLFESVWANKCVCSRWLGAANCKYRKRTTAVELVEYDGQQLGPIFNCNSRVHDSIHLHWWRSIWVSYFLVWRWIRRLERLKVLRRNCQYRIYCQPDT